MERVIVVVDTEANERRVLEGEDLEIIDTEEGKLVILCGKKTLAVFCKWDYFYVPEV